MSFLANASWNNFFSNLLEGIKNFFSPDLSGYENFSMGSDSMVNIHVIVFGVFIGVMIAAGYSIYLKKILGAFVRKLISLDAFSAENSKSLAELGMEKNLPVKLGLRGYTLGRVVNSVEKDEFIASTNKARKIYEENCKKAAKEGKRLPPFPEPSFKKKVGDCRYYIAEKNRYTAEMRFNDNGSGYGTFFFVLLIAIICVVIVYALLPDLMKLVDTVLADFTVKGNTYIPVGVD